MKHKFKFKQGDLIFSDGYQQSVYLLILGCRPDFSYSVFYLRANIITSYDRDVLEREYQIFGES